MISLLPNKFIVELFLPLFVSFKCYQYCWLLRNNGQNAFISCMSNICGLSTFIFNNIFRLELAWYLISLLPNKFIVELFLPLFVSFKCYQYRLLLCNNGQNAFTACMSNICSLTFICNNILKLKMAWCLIPFLININSSISTK